MRKITSCIFICYCICSVAVWAQSPNLGGDTTVFVTDSKAFSKPANNLALTRRDRFFIGNAFFRNPWVSAPASTTARDGLGPLFNTNACQSCHIRDGRGRPPNNNERMTSMLVRVGLQHTGDTGSTKISGVVADPVYGFQIQNRAIQGVPPEASINIEWLPVKFKLNDGEVVTLRAPKVRFSDLNYGPLHEQAAISLRVAPAMIGLGLLEAVPNETLIEIAASQNSGDENISGRQNMVWDVELQATVPGRFGWKAGQPTVKQQVASAFVGDMGITSSLFPDQPCTSKQKKCVSAPSGGNPEVIDEFLDFVTFYSKTLAVPARRNINDEAVKQGETLFRQAGCNSCHIETLHTGVDAEFPELSKQKIHPYTDLLLHNMGDGLADKFGEFEAEGNEWRTPPLWGIGLLQTVNGHTNLLHDGRARNIEEAILWHGGEAEFSRDHYIDLSKSQRAQLLKFLNSL